MPACRAKPPKQSPRRRGKLAALETRMLESMNALQWRTVGLVIAANALLLAAFKLIP